MPEERNVKRVFTNIPEGKNVRWKAKMRAGWTMVKNDLKKMAARGWRKVFSQKLQDFNS